MSARRSLPPFLDLSMRFRYDFRMNRWLLRLLLVAFFLAAFTYECPAPLIYKPGEGWIYQKVGEDTKWTRTRAKDQLDIAQQAFDKKDSMSVGSLDVNLDNPW